MREPEKPGATVRVPRVFVLEDDPETRRQLSADVGAHARLLLAASAGSLAEAVAWWDEGGRAEAALVDLGLPDGDGVDFIRLISSGAEPPAVLVITALGDETHVIRAIEAGATGYLLKERGPDHVVDSILTVLEGGSPISPSIARHLLKRFRPADQDQDRVGALTKREEEVLRLIVKGYTYKEIATALEVSFHTVTSHVQHIYRKLSVRSRGEAVFEAIQMGLVSFATDGRGP
jgi:DNA-binding NarL/FixJ family response regulator